MDDRETVKTWVVRNLDLLADYRTDAVENSLTNMVAAVRAPLEQRIKELEEWKVLWSEEDDRMEQRIATLTAQNERLTAALRRIERTTTCAELSGANRLRHIIDAALAAPKEESDG